MTQPGRPDWSREEVEAVVADYFAMLAAELHGEEINKTAHRRRLRLLLSNRSDGSIERKHQNISAILLELGYPAIDGYKPLGNYQRLLAEVVTDRLGSDSALQKTVIEDVASAVVVPEVDQILLALVEAPVPKEKSPPKVSERPAAVPRPRAGVNFLELEARNSALGHAGEEFIANYERAWLLANGQGKLASRVEHVSVSRGDGLGYDVLSFDPDGREKWLEVKTTRYGRYTPFFASRNEVDVSERNQERFHLCRVFDFRASPQFYRVAGSMRLGFDLDTSQFIARVA